MEEVTITFDAGKNLLLKLDVTSVMGPDDIHSYVLQASVEQLAQLLYNRSKYWKGDKN